MGPALLTAVTEEDASPQLPSSLESTHYGSENPESTECYHQWATTLRKIIVLRVCS